jgi:hypothetical protein
MDICEPHRKHLSSNVVFTERCICNGIYPIVTCVFVVAEMCLPNRFRATDQYVIVHFIDVSSVSLSFIRFLIEVIICLCSKLWIRIFMFHIQRSSEHSNCTYVVHDRMNLERLVEWNLAGETKILVENFPHCQFFHHESNSFNNN